MEDYIINFLARKASQEDLQKLKDWLANEHAHREELKQLLVAWDASAALDAVKTVNSDEAYRRFLSRVQNEGTEKLAERATNPVFWNIFRIAAIFVLGFSLGIACLYLWTNDTPEEVAFIENIVPLGSRCEVRLPDGSEVILNAGSTLRYPAGYGKTQRNIFLSGEGYFKVVQLVEKPFTVHTALSKITALGTEFNVKAYHDENAVETILINGEIIIETTETVDDFEHAVLHQMHQTGHKLSIISDLDARCSVFFTHLEEHIAEAEISWKEHNWRIEGASLHELSSKLARRFNANIYIEEHLKNQLFTGSFEHETLEDILRIIQKTIPLLYHIDGKNVFIHATPL